jgi:hypothetical protein
LKLIKLRPEYFWNVNTVYHLRICTKLLVTVMPTSAWTLKAGKQKAEDRGRVIKPCGGHATLRDNPAVGIAAGHELDAREVGVRVPLGASLSSPRRPERFWGPPSLLSNGYRRFFLQR